MAPAPEPSRAIFAANVVRIRERKGLTQEQLGWAAGLHQTAVTRIESGERMPTLPTILKIAEGLEVPPADLFTGID
jgi:transcriptional regulator with XRE-family HTH domain